MNLQCKCILQDGNSVTLKDCRSFSLVRERYTPYAVFQASLYAELLPEDALPVEVQFSLEGQLLHDGMVLHTETMTAEGQRILQLKSKSYTSQLTRCQPVPGIHSNVTLQKLMETYSLPHVTYQGGMGAINYVYVEENSSTWEALLAYNYKLNRGCPYVRVPNLVCVLPQSGTDVVQIPQDSIMQIGSGGDSAEMISRIDMADAAGTYGSFTATNAAAAQYGIVRVRQIKMDQQYLYTPPDALSARISYSNRKMRFYKAVYDGYCGEDIEDLADVGGAFTARVGAVTIIGNTQGITTTDLFYFDDFCNL